MKLSEALRLGEFALPPVHGSWFTRKLVSGKLCGGCAVGRAVYAAGFRPREMSLNERLDRMSRMGVIGHWSDEYTRLNAFITRQWPWTRLYSRDRYKHPTLLSEKAPNAILNDLSEKYEIWSATMPQLADWVEQLEQQYDSSVMSAEVSTTNQLEEVR